MYGYMFVISGKSSVIILHHFSRKQTYLVVLNIKPEDDPTITSQIIELGNLYNNEQSWSGLSVYVSMGICVATITAFLSITVQFSFDNPGNAHSTS